ncbi:MAG: DUF2752 domain-containing protein [Sphingobacteriaceae bacterium]|nr:DUF2752 domain-containing protein [Sphingobacteriaceae bacterium]
MKLFKKIPFELLFWIIALVLLANINPKDAHFSLCPLLNLGIDWCPGCGLGRSINHLFHANIYLSWQQHWFGIPALLIIFHRIFNLIKRINPINLNFKPNIS